LTFKSNGDLYFTDPPYGLPQQDDPSRELDFCGVYRLAKNGTVTLLTKEMSRPNGIAFSPDEKTLYVANFGSSARGVDGVSSEYRRHARRGQSFRRMRLRWSKDHPGLPDGMKVDRAGNIFATGPGGVHIFAPDGKRLGRIDTGQRTSNCAWGNDGSTLYMTADSYVCRIRTKTGGRVP
jgi:gluconolactonase